MRRRRFELSVIFAAVEWTYLVCCRLLIVSANGCQVVNKWVENLCRLDGEARMLDPKNDGKGSGKLAVVAWSPMQPKHSAHDATKRRYY